MNGDLDSELKKKKKKERLLVIEVQRNTGWACPIYTLCKPQYKFVK